MHTMLLNSCTYIVQCRCVQLNIVCPGPESLVYHICAAVWGNIPVRMPAHLWICTC